MGAVVKGVDLLLTWMEKPTNEKGQDETCIHREGSMLK